MHKGPGHLLNEAYSSTVFLSGTFSPFPSTGLLPSHFGLLDVSVASTGTLSPVGPAPCAGQKPLSWMRAKRGVLAIPLADSQDPWAPLSALNRPQCFRSALFLGALTPHGGRVGTCRLSFASLETHACPRANDVLPVCPGFMYTGTQRRAPFRGSPGAPALGIWFLWGSWTARVRGLGAVTSSDSSVNTADGPRGEEVVQEMHRAVRQGQARSPTRLLCPLVGTKDSELLALNSLVKAACYHLTNLAQLVTETMCQR